MLCASFSHIYVAGCDVEHMYKLSPSAHQV